MSIETLTIVLSAVGIVLALGASLFTGFTWVVRHFDDRIDAVDEKLTTRIDVFDDRLSSRIDELEHKLSTRIDGLAANVGSKDPRGTW